MLYNLLIFNELSEILTKYCKMLGHTNIRTTQIYAKIIDTKLSEDMDILANKLNNRKIPAI